MACKLDTANDCLFEDEDRSMNLKIEGHTLLAELSSEHCPRERTESGLSA